MDFVSNTRLIVKTVHTMMCACPFHGSLTQWDVLPHASRSSLSQPLNHARCEKMIEKCAVEDKDNLLWLKSCAQKNTNTWTANDKENARFLLSFNENVIMFTVANQKAIASYFHPSRLWVRESSGVQSTHTRCVFHLKLNPIWAVTIC